MDRFQPILAGEKLCFLCLKPTDLYCEKCLLPYCNQEHYKVHYNKEDEYCYPFRVLQKPMVCFSFLKNTFFSCIQFGWSDHKKCSFVDLILPKGPYTNHVAIFFRILTPSSPNVATFTKYSCYVVLWFFEDPPPPS